MTLLGGILALLAAGTPARATQLAWPPALAVSAPSAPDIPLVPAIPAPPAAAFKGASFKGAQFSRSDRVPESLISAIDRTERTLLLALYDLRLPRIVDALLRAQARGVEVRLIYDKGHGAEPSAEFLRLVEAGVSTRLLKGGGSFGIMHQKFALFDGEMLMTGSFNWTMAADLKNFENAMFVSDAALLDGFSKAWDWMWKAGADPRPAVAAEEPASPFGAPPADPLRPVAFAGGKWPRYAFSPQGGVEAMLIDAIGRARKTVDTAIFSLYSQRVADALIAAKARGVVVRVVGDSSQTWRSQAMRSLWASGVDVRLSKGRDGVGVMHHKYAIVDGRWLMTGSFNFSQNAELYNFENVLFTVQPGWLAAFGGELAAVWSQAAPATEGDFAPPKPAAAPGL